jgi:hypothetical protein
LQRLAVRSKRVMSFNAINKKMRYYYRGGKGRRDLKWWEEGCIGEVAMKVGGGVWN